MTPKREKKESSDSIPNSESTDEKTKSKEAKKRKTESSSSDPVKKAKIKEHNFLDTITIVPDHKKKQKEEKERKKKAQQQLEKEKKIRQELEHQKKMETIKAERMRSNSDAGNNPPLGEKRDRRDSLIQSSTILAPEKKRPKTEQPVSQVKPPLSPVRSPKPIATQSTPPTVIETPAPPTTPKLFIPNVPPVTPKSEKPVTQEKTKKTEPPTVVVQSAKKTPGTPVQTATPTTQPKTEPVKKSPFKPKRAWLTEVAQAALDTRSGFCKFYTSFNWLGTVIAG